MVTLTAAILEYLTVVGIGDVKCKIVSDWSVSRGLMRKWLPCNIYIVRKKLHQVLYIGHADSFCFSAMMAGYLKHKKDTVLLALTAILISI